MKFLLWILAFALLMGKAHADDKTYKWLLDQYETQNRSVIIDHALGQINGEPYLALIANDPSVDRQYLAVYKRSQQQNYVGIALVLFHPLPGSRVEITSNAIFFTTSSCHHGCYDERYQFQNVGQQLKLVGIESQEETWCSNFGAPDGCGYGVRLGNSYNLLTSATVCWFEKIPESEEVSKHHKPFRPSGIKHKMTFSRIDLPLLDGFDLDNFSLPPSCNFDYQKKLHLESDPS